MLFYNDIYNSNDDDNDNNDDTDNNNYIPISLGYKYLVCEH
jgi:hypothetical protein